jgi:hypothetical protein
MNLGVAWARLSFCGNDGIAKLGFFQQGLHGRVTLTHWYSQPVIAPFVMHEILQMTGITAACINNRCE